MEELLQIYPLISPDKPATPILTTGNNDITEGDDIILSCSTTTSFGITSYEFRRNGLFFDTSLTPFYSIRGAAIGTHDGVYTCLAISNTLSSDTSGELTISSELMIIQELF